jgi:hypothetical protein
MEYIGQHIFAMIASAFGGLIIIMINMVFARIKDVNAKTAENKVDLNQRISDIEAKVGILEIRFDENWKDITLKQEDN